MLHRPVELAQYTSLAFTAALREAEITGSIGSVGDALDNALMESAIGLYKTELIDTHPIMAGCGEVERETAAYVSWFNAERLHSSLATRRRSTTKPATVSVSPPKRRWHNQGLYSTQDDSPLR